LFTGVSFGSLQKSASKNSFALETAPKTELAIVVCEK
jgi:hypothetical protein